MPVTAILIRRPRNSVRCCDIPSSMEHFQLVSAILSFLVLGFAICLSVARFCSRAVWSSKRDRVLFFAFVVSLGLCSGASGAFTISTVFLRSRSVPNQKIDAVVEALKYAVQIQLGILPVLVLSGKWRAHMILDSWLRRRLRRLLTLCLVLSLLTAAICSLLSLLPYRHRLPQLLTPLGWLINTLLTLIPLVHFVVYCRRRNASWFIPACFLWAAQLTAVTYMALYFLDGNILPLVQCVLFALWTCLTMSSIHLALLVSVQAQSDRPSSVRSISWCSPMLPPTPSRDFFDHSDPFAACVSPLPPPPPAHVRSRSNVSFASLHFISFDNFRRKLIGKKSSGSLQVRDHAAMCPQTR
ncbi:hypothetical protein OE88DRAFT_1255024 [Heliocybe sulcata]|uniref:Uncharacterized protein n=1 Tax=Heliocybe sulcata TaxID=5364 RepID=A0A5C3NBZ8_9AGAM|nr:hypothetical protein OE88DRAFT_1255024 [Heliocybe sulcata]